MTGLQRIYRRLRSERDASVDRAMAAALASCDPLAMRLIVLSLIERRHPEGLLGLVLWFHRLPPELQDLVVRQSSDLFRPLREATNRQDEQVAMNVLRIIRQSASTRLAYLVNEHLKMNQVALRQEAGECLLSLARAVAADPLSGRPPACDAGEAQALVRVLEQAVHLYPQHKQVQALMGMAAMCPRPLAELAHLLPGRDETTQRVCELLVTGKEAELKWALIPWLEIDSLSAAALDGLGRLDPRAGLREAVRSAHLLRMPRLPKKMLRLHDPERLIPRPEHLADWPAHRMRRLVDWLVALPVPAVRRAEALADLTHCGDAQARLAAVRALVHLADRLLDEPRDDVNECITRFCEDPHPVIARIALRHLMRQHWPGLDRLLPQLISSPHEQLRQIASGHLGTLGFDKLWQAWPRMAKPQRVAAGKALIKLDPRFHKHLGDKLARRERTSRLRALSVIEHLQQGVFFEKALVRLTHDQDAHVVAAAVMGLGSAESLEATHALEACLNHRDARVRANAVEALEQLKSERHLNSLMKMAESEEPRPRANAIHALMDSDSNQALENLRNMLSDQRSNQRVSGLWVAQSLGLIEVAREVAELAVSDPDAKVRDRAQKVIAGMIEAMGSGASFSPESLGDPEPGDEPSESRPQAKGVKGGGA